MLFPILKMLNTSIKKIFGGVCLLFAASIILPANAQSLRSGYETVFIQPKDYTLYQTQTPIKIDGDLSDKSWMQTPWTAYFIDIEGEKKTAPAYKTRVKMLWDEKYLYIATQMEEPHLWANKQNPTDIIFRDNVFKIFIDPNNDINNDFILSIKYQVWRLA